MPDLKTQLTSKDILTRLIWEYNYKGNVLTWNNVTLPFESDFFILTKSGYMSEFEIKVSRSDFKADFRKQRYLPYIGRVHKHEMMKNGEYPLKHFSFVVPENLVSVDEVPEYAGLYYARPRNEEFPGRWGIDEIKAPPRLRGAKKITDDQRWSLMRSLQFRQTTPILDKLSEDCLKERQLQDNS